jgi:hypothetical protein
LTAISNKSIMISPVQPSPVASFIYSTITHSFRSADIIVNLVCKLSSMVPTLKYEYGFALRVYQLFQK